MTLFTGVFLGLFYSVVNFSDFFTQKLTIKYFIYNRTLIKNIVYNLPGVFENNPLNAVNGSLWTLPYELVFYCLLPFIYFVLRSKKVLCLLILAILININYFFTDFFIFVSRFFPFLPSYLYTLFLSFLAGVFFFLYKEKI